MDTISIVGQGFVGNAVNQGMKHAYRIETYDKFCPEKSTVSHLGDLVEKTDFVFVCVPTPMRKDGSCDISIVEDVVGQLADCYKNIKTDNKPVIVVKSTVPPGTSGYLNCKYQHVDVGFNPEFLREASPVDDFLNQTRIVLGGTPYSLEVMERIYSKAYPEIPILKTDTASAELVKYVTNCFLAMKVSFANEIYQFCDKMKIDYDEVIDIVKRDERLGDSHWMVPGPMPDHNGDLKPGFSGSCFVKDINALIHQMKSLDIDPKVLLGAWNKNLEVRPERDWEHLIGRAVSE